MYTRVTMLGVNLDIDPIDLPPSVWTESLNMVAQPGAMARAGGYQQVFSGNLNAGFYMMYSPQLGEPYWMIMSERMVTYIDPNGDSTNVTPASMVSQINSAGWSGGNLNGIAIMNNADIDPVYWHSGLGICTDLPGLRPQTRYNVMRTFKYHCIGLGVTGGAAEYLDQVQWSDAADPGSVPSTWVPAADNEAGDNVLADENGDIIDGLALRDSFFIYKQDSIYEMTYIGGASVFRFRKVFGTTGVLTKNCIVRVKGTHVVLGNGDIYQHDGQNLQSIVDGKIRDAFFAAIDNEYYTNSFVVYNEAKEQVWFCAPSTGNSYPDIALVWNQVTNEFGYRSLAQTDIFPATLFAATGVVADAADLDPEPWDGDSQAWNEDSTRWLEQTLSTTEDSVLMSTLDPPTPEQPLKGDLFKGDTGTTANGNPYRSTVGRLGLDLQDPQREKAIRRVWPRINAPADTPFTIELFNQRDPMANQEQVEVQQFIPGTEGVAVNCNVRYLGMRIWTDASVDWNVAGVDLEYMPQGHF